MLSETKKVRSGERGWVHGGGYQDGRYETTLVKPSNGKSSGGARALLLSANDFSTTE